MGRAILFLAFRSAYGNTNKAVKQSDYLVSSNALRLYNAYAAKKVCFVMPILDWNVLLIVLLKGMVQVV